MSIVSNIKSALSKTESLRKFTKFVEERSQTADKSLAGTLMSTLTLLECPLLVIDYVSFHKSFILFFILII